MDIKFYYNEKEKYYIIIDNRYSYALGNDNRPTSVIKEEIHLIAEMAKDEGREFTSVMYALGYKRLYDNEPITVRTHKYTGAPVYDDGAWRHDPVLSRARNW